MTLITDQSGTLSATDTVDLTARTGYPVSVLGKAHLLLAAFHSGPATMGLTELSRRSGVPKASAHRLAVELATLGLLDRSGDGYQLGWRIFELGQLVPGPAQLRAVARPALMDLRTGTRGVAHLAVPQGDDCVYLERLSGRREMRLLAAVGSRVPNHRTASGHLFLAYGALTHRVRATDEVLGGFGVRTEDELDRHLTQIRDRRHAEEEHRLVPGFKTVAVPVFAHGTTQLVAAISITMSADRKDDQQVLHALWAASRDITGGLARADREWAADNGRLVS
ncbi:IclR family transcriptional regulator [Gordonia sp. NPDC003376]